MITEYAKITHNFEITFLSIFQTILVSYQTDWSVLPFLYADLRYFLMKIVEFFLGNLVL